MTTKLVCRDCGYSFTPAPPYVYKCLHCGSFKVKKVETDKREFWVENRCEDCISYQTCDESMQELILEVEGEDEVFWFCPLDEYRTREQARDAEADFKLHSQRNERK